MLRPWAERFARRPLQTRAGSASRVARTLISVLNRARSRLFLIIGFLSAQPLRGNRGKECVAGKGTAPPRARGKHGENLKNRQEFLAVSEMFAIGLMGGGANLPPPGCNHFFLAAAARSAFRTSTAFSIWASRPLMKSSGVLST